MDDITRYIPQRDPILMVDALEEVADDECTTSLTVRPGNFFLDEDGMLAEAGLVENIAQSASAFVGYKAVCNHATPGVGFIGEVKRFRCLRRPAVGERLTTTISMGPAVGDVTIIKGEARVNDEVVAETQMKIAME